MNYMPMRNPRHSDAHPDPLEFWGECSMCAAKIEGDIDEGIRCKHGEYIPDGKITDIPCPKCEKELERSIDADREHQVHRL